MFAVIFAIVGTIGLIALGAHSYRDEKDSGQRKLLLWGNGASLIAIWIAFVQQHLDGASNERAVVEATDRFNTITSQYATLQTQNKELKAEQAAQRNENTQLRAQLGPVIEAARSKHPGLGEADAIERLLTELDKLDPKLEWVPSRTLRETGIADGPYRTTFFFQPRTPVAIRDARLTLTFTTSLAPVERAVEVTTSGTLPYSDNVKIQVTSKNTIDITIGALSETALVKVAVKSRSPLEILKADLKP